LRRERQWQSGDRDGACAARPAVKLDPLRDQKRAYAAKAIAAGVPTIYREFAETIHGFLGFCTRNASSKGQPTYQPSGGGCKL
jgi:hypothetical protein